MLKEQLLLLITTPLYLVVIGFEILLSHSMIAVACVVTNILFISLAYLLRSYGTTMIILALTTTSVLLVSIIYYSRPKFKAIPFGNRNQKETILKSHKILTLAGEPVEQD